MRARSRQARFPPPAPSAAARALQPRNSGISAFPRDACAATAAMGVAGDRGRCQPRRWPHSSALAVASCRRSGRQTLEIQNQDSGAFGGRFGHKGDPPPPADNGDELRTKPRCRWQFCPAALRVRRTGRAAGRARPWRQGQRSQVRPDLRALKNNPWQLHGASGLSPRARLGFPYSSAARFDACAAAARIMSARSRRPLGGPAVHI